MFHKILVYIITPFFLASAGLMLFKSNQSHKRTPELGVTQGRLKACSSKPNCVSSFSSVEDEKHYYPPFESDSIEQLWGRLNEVIAEMKFEIITIDGQYIHATQTTRVMHFVDDLEFLLSETDNKIYVRSSSRVGYSDFGANRKRMDEIYRRVRENP